MEAIATGLEAIAARLEAISCRLEAVASSLRKEGKRKLEKHKHIIGHTN